MRNPKWHRDEIILALDLYFSKDRGTVQATNPHIIELSKLLNKLPIHEEIPDSKKFRNANGVSLKLSNFMAIDPLYSGKGMTAYSRLDEEIFMEFVNNKKQLSDIATKIKNIVLNSTLNYNLYKIENEEEENESAKEGQILYKLHKYKERNRSIIKKKKESYLKKYGKLNCEICGFDFVSVYGEIGAGFIECHHKKALSELTEETETTLNDLILVCPNCHRMLHRKSNLLSIEELKNILNHTLSN